MKAKAFFLLMTFLAALNSEANSSETIRLSGVVSPRVDRVLSLENGNLLVTPENEPGLKVIVQPLQKRLPASKNSPRLNSTQTLSEPSVIVVEAP